MFDCRLHWVPVLLCALAAVAFFGGALHYSSKYAEAHAAAWEHPYVPGALHMGPSPETYYQRAIYAAAEIYLCVILSLALALKTRSPAWFVCLTVCGGLALFAFFMTTPRL
jgi:hypothetical protein